MGMWMRYANVVSHGTMGAPDHGLRHLTQIVLDWCIVVQESAKTHPLHSVPTRISM